MNKTLKWLFPMLILAGILLFSFSSEKADTKQCSFCNPDIISKQKFYEDDLIIALYTHKPVFPGHCLIIPKRHVERFELLSDAELGQIHRVIKKVNRAVESVFGTSAYLLLQKNGKEVGQTVPHLHFHYIPRLAGDDSTVKFFFNMWIAAMGSPIHPDEMQDIVEALRLAMGD